MIGVIAIILACAALVLFVVAGFMRREVRRINADDTAHKTVGDVWDPQMLCWRPAPEPAEDDMLFTHAQVFAGLSEEIRRAICPHPSADQSTHIDFYWMTTTCGLCGHQEVTAIARTAQEIEAYHANTERVEVRRFGQEKPVRVYETGRVRIDYEGAKRELARQQALDYVSTRGQLGESNPFHWDRW